MAHPPGHGLAALVGKLVCLVPLGPAALKVGLASALCGAGAAALTAALGRDLARRVREAMGVGRGEARGWSVDDGLGAAAGLAFGLSYAAAFQAVRPEVYALSALLVLAALRELVAFDTGGDRRRLYLASLWAGLALANHHLLALAALAPAVIPLTAKRWRGAAVLARVLAALALALALYAYLPLRALRHPLVDWGAPLTARRVFWTVSAQAFQKAVARGSTGDLGGVGLALAGELHPLGALLALAGVYVLLRQRGLRRVGLALLLAALGEAATPALVGFDPANPDAYGYLEVAVALLAVLACALPAALAARLDRPSLPAALAARLDRPSLPSLPSLPRAALLGAAAPLGAAVLALLALAHGLLGFPRVTLAERHEAAATFGAVLARSEPRALVVTSYFQTIFGLWYLRAVEGARPDLDLVHRHFLAYPGYREELLARRPALAPLLGPRDLTPAAAARPLLVEYDLDLPEPFVPTSAPIPAVPALPDEPQARRFAAWQAFLAAHRACRLGDRALLVQTRAQARVLLGEAPELAALCEAQ